MDWSVCSAGAKVIGAAEAGETGRRERAEAEKIDKNAKTRLKKAFLKGFLFSFLRLSINTLIKIDPC